MPAVTANEVEREIAKSPAMLGARAARGAVALLARKGVTTAVTFVGSVLLARLLTPRDFGIFAVMTFVFAFANSIGDGGLAATLVRQPTEPTQDQLNVVFTAQQAMAWGMAGTVIAAAALLATHVPAAATFLLIAVALSIILTAFQVVPIACLERKLLFARLGYIESFGTLVFYGTAAALAASGLGVRSFGIALVAQSAVVTCSYVVASRYTPRLSWTPRELKERYAYGIPFQGMELISLAKDAFTPFFVGVILGARQAGYITWANQMVAYALVALMALSRLYLPVFSRLRGSQERLATAVERAVALANAITVPPAIFVLVYAGPLVNDVFGPKWQPALPLVYIMWSANLLVPTATPVMALVMTLGDSRFGFKMSLTWMAGTWLLGVPLITILGIKGFAIANLAVQASNFWLFTRAKQLLPLRLLRAALPAWLVGFGLLPFLLIMRVTWSASSLRDLVLQLGLWLAACVIVLSVAMQERRREFFALLKAGSFSAATEG